MVFPIWAGWEVCKHEIPYHLAAIDTATAITSTAIATNAIHQGAGGSGVGAGKGIVLFRGRVPMGDVMGTSGVVVMTSIVVVGSEWWWSSHYHRYAELNKGADKYLEKLVNGCWVYDIELYLRCRLFFLLCFMIYGDVWLYLTQVSFDDQGHTSSCHQHQTGSLKPYTASFHKTSSTKTADKAVCSGEAERMHPFPWLQVDGLVQGRRNSSALTMELRLSCTNPSRWCWMSVYGRHVLNEFCRKHHP